MPFPLAGDSQDCSYRLKATAAGRDVVAVVVFVDDVVVVVVFAVVVVAVV